MSRFEVGRRQSLHEPHLTLACSASAVLIDPDTLLRKNWEKAQRAERFAVTGTPEAEAGLILTASFKPDIIVLDLRLRSLGSHRAANFAEIRRRSQSSAPAVVRHPLTCGRPIGAGPCSCR